MHVTVIGPAHPLKGGVAQHTVALAIRLRNAGHRVEIVSWSRQYPARIYPGEQEVKGAPELEDAPPIRRSLAWNRPDSWIREARALRGRDLVVLAHVTPVQVVPYRTMLACMRRSGARTVVVCHNVLPHERTRVDRLLVSWLLRAPGLVITHTEREATLARELTSRPVRVAPLAQFMPTAFRPRSSPEGEHRRLLFFGLIRPYKGLDVLIRALAQGPPDVKLRVAGEFWGGTDETTALVDELGLAERVELRSGYVEASEVPHLFEDVDALVLPYRTATGTQGVAMGFEFGVPVIVTRAGALADGVRDGVDGLVAEPDDVESLASALRNFYAGNTRHRLLTNVQRVEQDDLWARYLGAVTAPVDR